MGHSTHSHAVDGLSADAVFDLLSHRRRRLVVEHLSDGESETGLRELAGAIDSEEMDDESAAPTDRIALTLHHVHLPRLADADLVDYDAETNTVTPTRIQELTPFVNALDDGG